MYFKAYQFFIMLEAIPYKVLTSVSMQRNEDWKKAIDSMEFNPQTPSMQFCILQARSLQTMASESNLVFSLFLYIKLYGNIIVLIHLCVTMVASALTGGIE